MEMSFTTAQNGLFAATRRQNVVANNISNLTTPGFKSVLVDQETLRVDGTHVQSTRENFAIGDPQLSDDPLDLYIAGDGFFQVARDGEPAYTRAGNFSVDEDLNVVAPSGHLLEPNITVPADSVRVNVREDGLVTSTGPDGTETAVGNIQLVRFVNPSGLVALGDNLYGQSNNSGDPVIGTPGQEGLGSILGFAVEGSNVDPAREITDQIVTQRYYQLNLRVFQTSDALVGRALDLFT